MRPKNHDVVGVSLAGNVDNKIVRRLSANVIRFATHRQADRLEFRLNVRSGRRHRAALSGMSRTDDTREHVHVSKEQSWQ